MPWQSSPITKQALLWVVALLLMVVQVRAGEHVRAGKPPAIRSQPVSAAVARFWPSAETVSVVVTTLPRASTAPVYVDIRGPDGQLRRFPLEGGRAAIQYRQVILHPGERLTIQWPTPK